MKIRPVGTELFHAEGRTSRRSVMTELTVAFRTFAGALKKLLESDCQFDHLYTTASPPQTFCLLLNKYFKMDY